MEWADGEQEAYEDKSTQGCVAGLEGLPGDGRGVQDFGVEPPDGEPPSARRAAW